MEYMYVITTYYDGELYNTHRIADFTDAARVWELCKDSGNAKEYATYNLTDPAGKMYTKNFYTDGRVSVKQVYNANYGLSHGRCSELRPTRNKRSNWFG